MEENNDKLIRWASFKVRQSHFWGMLYWTLHNWFVLISWAVSISVPFGLGILLLNESVNSKEWNTVLLISSGSGLIIQLIDTILRLKERAIHGRRMSSELEIALLKFQSDCISKQDFLNEIKLFLDQDWKEEGP